MSSKIDVLYARGIEVSGDFGYFYTNLRPALLKYAGAICKDVLRRVDEHLVIEMTDDLLMDMAVFEGRSQFSTWVHSYFRFRCLTELRYRNKSLGEPLVEDVAWMNHETDDQLTLAEIQQGLSTKQQAVVQARLEGYTAAEIAGQMGLSERGVYWLWESVLEDLSTVHK